MTRFTDNAGAEWSISLDGFTLGELRDAKKIDLADPAGLDYARCERDPSTLVASLAIICADDRKQLNLSERDFAKRLTGEVLEKAWEALWGAAKVFFPPRLWSALESNLETHRQMDAIRPMMAALDQPGVSETMRETVMNEVANMLRSGVSSALETLKSAPGQGDALSSSAITPQAA